MRALIICGGTPPRKKLFENEFKDADLTLGADSGGYVFLGFHRYPHLVIGDMDSFKYTGHEGIKTLHDTDQETNDLEKALNYALSKGVTTCIVLGALGKRFDHTLKNLSVLLQFNDKFDELIFRDDYGDMFLVKSGYELGFPVGTVVSFMPIGGPVEGFTSTGVLYPLTNTPLIMGVQDGTSNEITETGGTVTFTKGNLCVFIGTGEKMKHQKRD